MKVFIDKIAEQALKKCDEFGITAPSHRESFTEGYRYGAKWKDQQFKEYIETHKQPVLASETDDTIVGYSIDVDEIINELFKED